MTKLPKKLSTAIVRDIFDAETDLSGLAERHQLDPGELASWMLQDDSRECLAGLCLLADFQTQLMLSRYRQHAVSELIKQATSAGEEGGVSTEQARKACVDLLRADLKRAMQDTAGRKARAASKDDEQENTDEWQAIRAALFGDDEATPAPAGDAA